MESGRMAYKIVYIGVLSAMMTLPAAGYADETVADRGTGTATKDFFAGLEDLPLRRYIAGIGHLRVIAPSTPALSETDVASDVPYVDTERGSAGGYVNFGSPPTSTFLDSAAKDATDGVAFGVTWRPDVSDPQDQDFRPAGHGLSGGDAGRVGLRADLTALLYDDVSGEGGSSAWRLTGMLGSTSLSLVSDDSGLALSSQGDSAGLLWDVGVGWSRGAMSLSAGYQSSYGLDEAGDEGSAIAVLSLGADYTLLPGFSVYGELNVIDGPPDDYEDGLGTLVIFGTGVTF
jgi:hypothetical protein